jgi:Leucine-rich repeat (LRR) protein
VFAFFDMCVVFHGMFFAFSSWTKGAVGQNISQAELDALHDLYAATAGENWTWREVTPVNNVWNFTADANPCADFWQGVVCATPVDGEKSYIVSLELANYTLTGWLPSSIGNLTQLSSLDLGTNSISGTIPSSVGNLHRLQSLYLNDNSITGTIPAHLGALANLTELVLGHNLLEGTIPHELTQLRQLRVLHLNNNNQFTGAIPDWLGGLWNLTDLQLRWNALRGSIPASLCNATSLKTLFLHYNHLTGPIPDTFGQLVNVELLFLYNNRITGTVPSALGDMRSAREFELGHNAMHGTVPATLGNLPLLTTLALLFNDLTGTIPATIGQISGLAVLDLNNNRLNGTIPASLKTLTETVFFDVASNLLTGTLPSFLGGFHHLVLLRVDYNSFQGSLPDLTDTPELRYLGAESSGLTGTIPTFLCALQHLKTLYLASNQFERTIPTCIGQLNELVYLSVDYNALTGTIPASVANLSALESVQMRGNQLTGTIPVFRAPRGLLELLLDDNRLRGTIPASFGNPAHLQLVGLGNNHLTGTIPSFLGHLPNLLVLALDNNHLTGSVPTSFAKLRNLHELYLLSNHLDGDLHHAFNATFQVSLSSIDVSHNRLIGSLPDEVFKLGALTTFVALGNCFSGTLSDSICNNDRLVSLIADGLHTASYCSHEIFHATHSYAESTAFHGTIPACLFAMHSLASLHISGNALTGTIAATNISKRLIDLILSHNRLTGTIPDSVQGHKWRTLDLSYNRLTGTLRSDFGQALQGATDQFLGNVTYNTTSHSVAIQNNRLSGSIPSALVHLQNISMLGSNLFSCEVDKRDLPKHDNNRDNYECGSNSFYTPLYMVAGILLVALVVLCWSCDVPGVVRRCRAQLQTWKLTESFTPRHLMHVLTLSDILCQMSLWCTVLIVVLLMPWYGVASYYFGTYTYMYGWVISGAFLTGLAPALTELFLYAGLMIALVVFTTYAIRRKDSAERLRARTSARISQSSAAPISAASQSLPKWKRMVVYVAFVSANVFVVVGMNVAFVTVALTQDNSVLFIAQLLLSVFKLFWNTVCTPFLIYLATGIISQSGVSASFVTVQVLIGLFNNIAVPCLVVAVLSPSCFYSVFDASQVVRATFFVQQCTTVPGLTHCTYNNAKPMQSSYDPPFSYDYQCSSSFITYYAPAFVYLGIAAGLVTPLVKVVCVYLFTVATPDSTIVYVLKKTVPRILKPIPTSRLERSSIDTAPRKFTSAVSALRLWDAYRPHFDANSKVIALITYLGILLTFGAVFPPLAVVMCATIYSVAWQARVEVGRFLYTVRGLDALHLVDLIERECRGAVSLIKLRRGIFTILCVCCTFYSFFLVDTLGNAVGYYSAQWVMWLMLSLPFCIAVGTVMQRRLSGNNNVLGMSFDPSFSMSSSVLGVELSPLGAWAEEMQKPTEEQTKTEDNVASTP